MPDASEKRVAPYVTPPMTRRRLRLETYEYHMPFNYPNVTVDRRYQRGMEFHGVEMNPINSVAADDENHPPDTITIAEDQPIVRVAVIGSACVPPGFIQLEAEVTEDFHKPEDVPGVTAVRYRVNNLWGMHLRCDSWLARCNSPVRDLQDRSYGEIPDARKQLKPGLRKYTLKAHSRENPLVGMSSAVFEIPESSKVMISGGSELCAWTDDTFPADAHYSFRMIRVTVNAQSE